MNAGKVSRGRPKNSAPCTPQKIGAPVIACVFKGGHEFIPSAPATIVKFFKEHALP